MSDLIELLESFNRKERFWLLNQALGSFELSADFRGMLGEQLGLPIPECSFVAMDYHLDWLIAVLYAHKCGDVNRVFPNPGQRMIRGNQEDIDLLVAFRECERYHIILLEAKGATGWTNAQMDSKASRMEQIFGAEGNIYHDVKPHFCLSSPRPPQHLRAESWPSWMRQKDGSYIWLKLNFPEDTRMVTRCDADGKSSAEGSFFRIVQA